MKTCFIVNPRSGRAKLALPLVQAAASACRADVVLTTRPRHATELAHAALANGCERIIAVGGDGTLNEVASSVVATKAVFGLIPCGSGDGLGRHLGIHGSVPHALKIALEGEPRPIDSGVADGHPFFTAAGLGFEAEVSTRFNRLTGRGFFRYLTTSEEVWRNYVPADYEIQHGHDTTNLRAFTLVVSNSDQYGNGALIAPGARADDGLLDLTAVPPITPLNALPLFTRLFTGTIGQVAGVVRLQGTKFVVSRAEPGPIHTDGEVHAAGRVVEFTILPSSLRIMTPRPES